MFIVNNNVFDRHTYYNYNINVVDLKYKNLNKYLAKSQRTFIRRSKVEYIHSINLIIVHLRKNWLIPILQSTKVWSESIPPPSPFWGEIKVHLKRHIQTVVFKPRYRRIKSRSSQWSISDSERQVAFANTDV